MSPAPRRRAASLSLALALAACGGTDAPSDPLPTPPAGGPLASVRGELRPTTGAVPAQVRVALAWYPGLFGDADTALSAPGTVASSAEAYAPTAAYRLDVTQAPPAAALGALPAGLVGRGATGVVLAYADGNANGRLDTIPATGAPVDRVLGASLYGSTSAFLLVYAESEQPAASGLKQGVNLLQLSAGGLGGGAVPTTTPVPLELGNAPLLDLLVCEGTWDGVARAPCGLDLGDDAGGPDDPQEPAAPTVQGFVNVYADRAEADVRVAVDGVAVEGATVTVDGLALQRDAATGRYASATLPAGPFGDGEAVVRVVLGDATHERALAVPSAVQFTSSPRVVTNQPLQVRWAPASGAESYDVALRAADGALLESVTGLEVTGHDLPSQPAPTHVAVQVAAVRVEGDVATGGRIFVRNVRTQLVTVEAPAPAAPLQVEGEVVSSRYGTLTTFRALRGEQRADAPRAFIGQTELPYNPESGLFELVEPALWGSIFDHGPVQLRVVDGEDTVVRTLALPGRFQVTSPVDGTEVVRGSALTATWQASAGATAYNVSLVRLPDSGVLDLQVVGGGATELTLLGTQHEGGGRLFVEAVTVVDGSDTLGVIELRRYVEVHLSFVAP